MDDELEKKLYNKYPQLYRGKDDDMTESLMGFGFSVGNGWYNIVDELSSEIVKYCEEKGYDIPKVFQVKQKFGGLRFYLDRGVGNVYDIIKKYEKKSFGVCEICGEKGMLHKNKDTHWIKTLCDKHAEEEGYVELEDDFKRSLTKDNIKTDTE